MVLALGHQQVRALNLTSRLRHTPMALALRLALLRLEQLRDT